jgi:hypothetical protein
VGLSRLYTKNVHARWEETLVKVSAYKVTNDIEKGENCWLVQHTKKVREDSLGTTPVSSIC